MEAALPPQGPGGVRAGPPPRLRVAPQLLAAKLPSAHTSAVSDFPPQEDPSRIGPDPPVTSSPRGRP